ncbi:cytochrome c oxidase copper chaperone COX11 [Brevipalpus obovatus]|uniref:cytochrome c oxidase copper chaperone COX11 n=1 Tax=Brevipalpus obovatus TaxID=246614 RepID=UPI003D9DBB04
MYRSPTSASASRFAKFATSIGIGFLGISFAAVPVYRLYCQATGKGGRAFQDKNMKKIENMEIIKDKKIRVKFVADTASKLAWKFKPTFDVIEVHPGETTLAFFTAKNPLDVPVDGVATYAVVPIEAGVYLNKIQCFCFEEQRLNPKEEVDLPVFFYIDPAIKEDPQLQLCEDIVLQYQFWATKDGVQLPFLDKLKAALS